MDLAVGGAKVERRSFLGYSIAAVGAFVASVLGSATALFSASPLFSHKRGVWMALGPAAGFQVGVPKLVDFPMTRKDGWIEEDTTKSVWVVRTGENEFATFNPRCTHLGCIVSWMSDQRVFRSPCHGGIFSIEGAVLAGPPPRPLDRLENRIEGGQLLINYQEFRLGVSEKVEA